MKHAKDKEIVGFNFTTIPLAEAKALAMAGMGNYADLKAKLLQTLPELNPNEAFAFGLPKGEVPEEQRRGICMALNMTLKKAGHQWRVTYSGSKKLFICYPWEPRVYTKKRGFHSPQQQPPAQSNGGVTLQQIVKAAGAKWGLTQDDFTKRPVATNIAAMRKGIQFVAVRDSKVKVEEVSKFFGISKAGVFYNLRKMNDKDKMRTTELRQVIGG
jgi:hypothetical protein